MQRVDRGEGRGRPEPAPVVHRSSNGQHRRDPRNRTYVRCLVQVGSTGQAVNEMSASIDSTATSHTAPTDPQHASPLGERERAIIEFESVWFTLDENRHDAIRERFSCSVEEYNLELNRVIDHPAALLADPLVVRRLRRQRERRRRALIDGAAAGEHA